MSITAWGRDHSWPQTHWLNTTDSLNDNYLGYFATDALLIHPAYHSATCRSVTHKETWHCLLRPRMWEGRGEQKEKNICLCMCWWRPNAAPYVVMYSCPSTNPASTAQVGGAPPWILRRASFVLPSHTPWGFFWQLKASLSPSAEKCVLL